MCSVRKGVHRNFAKFTGKHLRQSLFFNKVAGGACNFIKKETLAQVFSCEFCEIFKNTFFTEHLRTTASKILSAASFHRYSENDIFNRTDFVMTDSTSHNLEVIKSVSLGKKRIGECFLVDAGFRNESLVIKSLNIINM